MEEGGRGSVSEQLCHPNGAGREPGGAPFPWMGRAKPTVLADLSIPMVGEQFGCPLGQAEPVPSAHPQEALWGHGPTEREGREREVPGAAIRITRRKYHKHELQIKCKMVQENLKSHPGLTY